MQRFKAEIFHTKFSFSKTAPPKNVFCKAFRNDVNSVLLGTGAYWEGISIEGKSLSNLVIFRLPFPVPDPIIEYKASIAKDAMMDVRVPEMIIKLKQGIGRLIRNFSDTGSCPSSTAVSWDTQPERYHRYYLELAAYPFAAPLISKRSKPFIIRYAIEAGLQSLYLHQMNAKSSAGDLFGPPRYSISATLGYLPYPTPPEYLASADSQRPAVAALAYAVRSIR